MSRRTGLFIAIILAFGAIYLVLATGSPTAPTSASVPAQSPTPTVEPTPTPATGSTPTPVPSMPERVAQAAGELEKSVTTPILAIAQLLAAILIIVFSAYGSAWLVDLIFRPSQMVMSIFENASGDSSLDPTLKGLSRLAREALPGELKGVADRIKKYAYRVGPPEYQVPDVSPQITEASDRALADMTKSLSEFAPDQLKPLVNLIEVVFPPRGTQINTTLLRMNDSTGGLGITFEIVDLGGQVAPQMRTIWESPPPRTAAIPSSRTAASSPALPPAQSPTMPLPQRLLRISELLSDIGLYQEAINYLEEALKIEPNDQGTADALAANLSKRQAQQGRIAGYTVGKQLHEAGLLELAVDSYLQPLPDSNQSSARAQWMVALGLTPGNQGEAYLTLARQYRSIDLFDESQALYQVAIAKGSLDAVSEVARLAELAATILTEIGKNLYELGRFSSAQGYLMTALQKLPSHAPAQAWLATLKQNAPLEDNREALAAANLAHFYAEQGMWSQAKSYYEEALKKQPTYAEARTALAAVLQQAKTLSERYHALLEVGVRYLAIELTRREMLAHIPMSIKYDPEHRQAYLGQVHNFVGALSQASIYTYEETWQFFFLIAVDYLKQARDLLPNWYQPYLNLGDTYEVGASYAQADDAVVYRREAIEQYKLALEKAKDPMDGYLIRTCKAIVLLKLNNPTDFADVYQEIQQVEQELDGQLESKEMRSRLLYNLATWYAIVQGDQYQELRNGVTDARDKAHRYIAACLERDRDRWYSAEVDPDLKLIKEDIKKIKDDILQARKHSAL